MDEHTSHSLTRLQLNARISERSQTTPRLNTGMCRSRDVHHFCVGVAQLTSWAVVPICMALVGDVKKQTARLYPDV